MRKTKIDQYSKLPCKANDNRCCKWIIDEAELTSEKDEYILFEDMSGEAFFGWETSLWLDFTGEDELIYAY